MSIIEDDSRNGMVPPPAGDSTRSLQASCDHACSRVNDSMFVGGGRVARDQHVLLQSGITHVLNCAGVSCDDYFPFERAVGATAFSLYACTESHIELGINNSDFINHYQDVVDRMTGKIK